MIYYNDPRDNLGTAEVSGKCFASTTNFVNWEFDVEVGDLTDIAELYSAIEKGKRAGKFNVIPNEENWFVLPSDGSVVLVLTPRSRRAYLNWLKPLLVACTEKKRGGLSSAEWKKTSVREKVTLFNKFRCIDL